MSESSINENTTGDALVAEYRDEIKGKVVIVTGVSPGGLGAWFVEAIAQASPQLIILAARDLAKAGVTATKVKEVNPSVAVRCLQLDTASLKSVRSAADDVLAYPEAIDVLVNNIGVMATPYSKTEDGFESQWQTNYLGPFLFTNLIIDKILASGPGARIVNVSSEGYRAGGVRYDDYNFHDGESYHPWIAYGASKTALILHAGELARRLGPKGLTTVSICPGAVMTGLQRHSSMESFAQCVALYRTLGDPRGWSVPSLFGPNKGIRNHVFASFAPEVKEFSGAYFAHLDQIPEPEEEMTPWAVGDLEGRRNWRFSERLLGQTFNFS